MNKILHRQETMNHRIVFILPLVFAVVLSTAQTPSQGISEQQSTKTSEVRIDGAGSLALSTLMQAWIDGYSRLHSGRRISYKTLGSKPGMRMLAGKIASFAAVDDPVSNGQLASTNGPLLQFPIAVTAVIPVYNLPTVNRLLFSGSTLAGIFLGRITKWNDPAIVADNPETSLPLMDIKVMHYFPDGTVETQVMADYLSKVSPDFKRTLGDSPNNWPLASFLFKGGEGTAGFVSTTPGSIGYLGFAAARAYEHTDLKWGAVKNLADEFVTASPKSLTGASQSAVPAIDAQANSKVSITNAPGNGAYPISYFVWFLFYDDSKDKKQHDATVDFLKWTLTDGQKIAVKLGFPPLPDNLVKIELERLRKNAIK